MSEGRKAEPSAPSGARAARRQETKAQPTAGEAEPRVDPSRSRQEREA